jgi:CRISPR/Cas system-associated endonuclease Cas1
MAHAGEFMTFVDCTSGRLARRELALRRLQMKCVLNPEARVAAARSLVALKLATLTLPLEAHHAALAASRLRGYVEPAGAGRSAFDLDAALASLASAPTLQDVMTYEAAYAAPYWRRYKGFTLAFRDGSIVPFTARARSWRTGRLGETGKQFSNRFALCPINAMLNYSGSIIVAQCARASAGLGLDPAFGILHSARPGMNALAWDIFELSRVRLESSVFAFIASHTFEQSEFKTVFDPKPHIKFTSPLARDLSAYILKRVPFPAVVKECRAVAALF